MSILEDFLKKTGKPLACPLCGKDDLLLPPAGVNQFRVVCRNCGHFMAERQRFLSVLEARP